MLEIYDALSAEGLSMREIAVKGGIKYATLRDSVRRRQRNSERRTSDSAVVWTGK